MSGVIVGQNQRRSDKAEVSRHRQEVYTPSELNIVCGCKKGIIRVNCTYCGRKLIYSPGSVGKLLIPACRTSRPGVIFPIMIKSNTVVAAAMSTLSTRPPHSGGAVVARDAR